MARPAAAPKRAWCPATCPPTAPTAAPFKQPLALAGTDAAAIKANRAKVKILDFMGFPVRLETPVADVDPLRAATCCLAFASVDLSDFAIELRPPPCSYDTTYATSAQARP